MSMNEDSDDHWEQKNVEKNSRNEQNEENEGIGNDLIGSPMNRSRQKNDIQDDSVPAPTHKKANYITREAHVGEMALFGVHFCDANLDRLAFQQDKLAFIRKGEEICNEGMDAQKLELENFKLMTVAFSSW